MSLEIDNDEESDAAEIKEEEWVEYIERSTIEVVEKMESEKIRCWKTTQRKMKWRLAMRIATSQKERWLIKAAEWNPELSSKYRSNRSSGRPGKRWEDDINEFLKQTEDETENQTDSSNHINKSWINTAKDRGRWTLLEENYTKNSVTRTRRKSHNRPARYVNGVKLSDEDIADPGVSPGFLASVVLHRIRGFRDFNSVNLYQQQLVFFRPMFSPCSVYCTLSSTVCTCKTCQQSKPPQL